MELNNTSKNIIIENESSNIKLILNKNNIELEFENVEIEHIQNYIDYNNLIITEKSQNSDEIEYKNISKDKIESMIINDVIVVKKKKGRKSKKDLLLNKEEIKVEVKPLFPTLAEKIFDVVNISNCEYYYDMEHNILMDSESNPKGYLFENKYIFYDSELSKLVEKDNKEVNNILKYFNSK